MSQIAVPSGASTPGNIMQITPDEGDPVVAVNGNVDFLHDVGLISYTDISDQGIETINLDGNGEFLVGLFGSWTRLADTIGFQSVALAIIQAENFPSAVYLYGSVTALSDLGVGATFKVSVCFLTNGSIVDVVGVSIADEFVDPSLSDVIISFENPGGVTNTLALIVLGVPGHVISWSTTLDYRFVS